ncbi:MAG: 2-amino-4-hydroxy-6-hydroxymethyldihydropteridine diphosphokinase [PVC group bacterium]|nr:2-amino-4-hydroxy-6-hydroxymethyldihydropteridine diphosphokinase [PVC group bacterium]
MNQKWRKVYLGIGSNLGNRKDNIEIVLSCLSVKKEIRIAKISPLYETTPVGGPPQDMFLNGVLCIETTAAPFNLLQTLKAIEQDMGRKQQKIKWSPRIIDLDILFYEEFFIVMEGLVIPHPLLHRRMFVLQPLADIAPGQKHPLFKKTVQKLYNELIEKNETN